MIPTAKKILWENKIITHRQTQAEKTPPIAKKINPYFIKKYATLHNKKKTPN